MAKPKLQKKQSSKAPKPLKPTGIASIDGLANFSDDACTIEAYIYAASEYVRRSGELNLSAKKAAQIRLSNGLGRALLLTLKSRLSHLNAVSGERMVSGALRTVNADVSELDELDGLRLAIEIKPVNLAVGRAIWNRFGDIRTFAVNLHLKFPFSVVGGVLAIPTYEAVGSPQEIAIELSNEANPKGEENEAVSSATIDGNKSHRSTIHLIERAISRLVRAGGRKTEGDASHLLEGIAVVVYDPDVGTLHPEIPAAGSGLRWEEFVDNIVSAYQSRFEN